MEKRVAILRGINVGGKRTILMADLKSLFSNLGFRNPQTYIQSGNVVFESDDSLSDMEIGAIIEKAISKKFGFDVPIIIRSAQELEEAIKKNPFCKEKDIDPQQLHLTFLKDKPLQENMTKTERFDYKPDRFIVEGKDIFVNCNGKYHETKLSNSFFEKNLKTSATTRNWKTVLEIYELLKEH